jgi:hypothetical protein
MGRVGGVIAACLWAAAWLACPECAAADANAAEAHFDRYLLFGGFDLWRNGDAAHGGLLWSPGGLASEGFTLKLLFAGGDYGYDSGGTTIDGRYGLTSAMAGWRFKRDRLEITVFVGPDFQWNRLTPDDPGNRMRGTHVGVRFGGDLWYQPSDSFMATTSVSLSTIGPNYWTRAAIGWYLFDRAWIGPEIMALGGDRYQQFRAGIHATAFKTGLFEWSGGVGYTRDSDDRNGGYVRIGVLTRR